MKIVIISDLHLTSKFEPEKFDFLVDLINKYEKIIINGDLWEGQIISFDQFLQSEWSKLFPLLKEKEVVYIYGNHDKSIMQDERNKLFSDVALDEYIQPLEGSDKELVIRHGDTLVKLPLTRFRTSKTFLNLVKIPNIARVHFENWIGKHLKWKKNRYSFWNRTPPTVYKKIKGPEWENKILVTSHFHNPEFAPEKRYINIGMILFHQASYLSIIDGEMELIKDTY